MKRLIFCWCGLGVVSGWVFFGCCWWVRSWGYLSCFVVLVFVVGACFDRLVSFGGFRCFWSFSVILVKMLNVYSVGFIWSWIFSCRWLYFVGRGVLVEVFTVVCIFIQLAIYTFLYLRLDQGYIYRYIIKYIYFVIYISIYVYMFKYVCIYSCIYGFLFRYFYIQQIFIYLYLYIFVIYVYMYLYVYLFFQSYIFIFLYVFRYVVVLCVRIVCVTFFGLYISFVYFVG